MTTTRTPRTDRSDAEVFRDFDRVGPGTLAGRYLRLFWHPVYCAREQIAVVGFGPSITVENPALGRAFVIAYLRGVRDYYAAVTIGMGKTEIVAIIAKYSTVKNATIVAAMTPVGLNPDGWVNVDGLVNDQQFYVDNGAVPTPVDMHALVDYTYVEAALQVLGSY